MVCELYLNVKNVVEEKSTNIYGHVIDRRDKKPSSVINAKKEKNNRMGKTSDLFKKIRDTKGTFHAKMGSIKDRNGMYLTEAEDIKKRWQENTEELYKKKSFSTKIITMV